MSIISATILPHSPLLLPGLTAEAREKVIKTTAAIKKIAEHLTERSPDIILLIAAHSAGAGVSNQYALLQAPELPYRFEEFGDLTTNGNFKGAVGFTHHLKETLETKFPIPQVTTDKLPYTFAVPLVCLGNTINNLPICCLQIPKEIPIDELSKLGDYLRELLLSAKEKVAVLAAGDLGHYDNSGSPDAKILAQVFLTACLESPDKLLNIDADLRTRTRECLWSPATLLYKILARRNFTTEITAYESPVSVGFLTAILNIN